MTLRDPDVAEPVITTRAQLRSSLGAHSRDPLADQGYTCFEDQAAPSRRNPPWLASSHGFINLASIRISSLAIGFRTDH
jgi:hypothetical protein